MLHWINSLNRLIHAQLYLWVSYRSRGSVQLQVWIHVEGQFSHIITSQVQIKTRNNSFEARRVRHRGSVVFSTDILRSPTEMLVPHPTTLIGTKGHKVASRGYTCCSGRSYHDKSGLWDGLNRVHSSHFGPWNINWPTTKQSPRQVRPEFFFLKFSEGFPR